MRQFSGKETPEEETQTSYRQSRLTDNPRRRFLRSNRLKYTGGTKTKSSENQKNCCFKPAHVKPPLSFVPKASMIAKQVFRYIAKFTLILGKALHLRPQRVHRHRARELLLTHSKKSLCQGYSLKLKICQLLKEKQTEKLFHEQTSKRHFGLFLSKELKTRLLQTRDYHVRILERIYARKTNACVNLFPK